jgi:hypothetical protein
MNEKRLQGGDYSFRTGQTYEIWNENKLARSFSFTFRYIDDILSLNNLKFGNFVDRLYPIELEIKNKSDIAKSASYIDLHREIDGKNFTTKEMF